MIVQKISGTLAVVLAIVLALSMPLTAASAAKRARAPVSNKLNWEGTYTLSDNAGRNAAGTGVVVDYRIRIRSTKTGLSATIQEQGYQTDETILASTQQNGGDLALDFKSYGNGKVRNQYGVAVYNVGEELLRLRKTASTQKALVIWNKMQPNSNTKTSVAHYSRK